MQAIVYTLTLLSAASFLLHISLLPQKWVPVLSGVLLAVFAFGFYPVAIQQNSQAVSTWLRSPVVAQGLAIFWIAEGMLLLTAGLSRLRAFYGQPIRERAQYAFYFSGHSGLLAVALTEILLFFEGFDMSFAALASGFASGLFLMCLVIPAALRRMLPENDLRLELKLLLHFLQMTIACLLTAGFDLPVPERESRIPDLGPLGLTLLVWLVLGMLGYLRYQVIRRRGRFRRMPQNGRGE